MIRTYRIEKSAVAAEPPAGFLARLAGLGVRLKDGSRYLVVDVPREVAEAPDWPDIEGTLEAAAARLRTVAVAIEMTAEHNPPDRLAERLWELGPDTRDVVLEVLGPYGSLLRWPGTGLTPAELDLLYAAFALGRAAAGEAGEEE